MGGLRLVFPGRRWNSTHCMPCPQINSVPVVNKVSAHKKEEDQEVDAFVSYNGTTRHHYSVDIGDTYAVFETYSRKLKWKARLKRATSTTREWQDELSSFRLTKQEGELNDLLWHLLALVSSAWKPEESYNAWSKYSWRREAISVKTTR